MASLYPRLIHKTDHCGYCRIPEDAIGIAPINGWRHKAQAAHAQFLLTYEFPGQRP